MSDVRVRFAPAPTGSLHVGGARTALYNYLFARRHGGALVLRSEDTDAERSSRDAETSIAAELHGLGLTWDEGPDVGGPFGPYRQSDRRDRYALAAARLLEIEAAYPCYCTPEELEAQRSAAEARGEAPRYPGTCRELTRQQRAEREAQGRKAALRFKMPQREIFVEDLIRGSVHFPAGTMGDFVVVKSDGLPTYNLAAVIDDSEMEITHVIRGDEHLPNTPRQTALYEALERPLPLFAHVSMILAPDHQKLSKRHGATSLREYREQGYVPEAIVNYLALLGWSPGDDRELFTLPELVEAFSLDRVHRSPAVFDARKLRWFNAYYLRAKPSGELAELFGSWAGDVAGEDGRDPQWRRLLADAIADHVEVLSDVPREIAPLVAAEVEIEPAARGALDDTASRDLVAELAAIADAAPDRAAFALRTTRTELAALGARHGVRGKQLYRPIRVAVSGSEHGIELPLLLPLLGPRRVAKRIRNALASTGATA